MKLKKKLLYELLLLRLKLSSQINPVSFKKLTFLDVWIIVQTGPREHIAT